jgi:prepilin-type N-terminal cleavage/methylation domain-containing protein/prepilin-type processing-associated H-X9-DG protein
MHVPRTRAAFSLIEVLVVIGIIALLLGLLLPTMRGVRERAKSIQCASQLRQLGTGFYTYAAQNHGELPSWSNWHVVGGDGTGDDEAGPGWTEELAPFYSQPLSGVYDCPSFPHEYRMNYFLESRWNGVSDRSNMKLAEIRTSSHFILSGDCTSEWLYPKPFGVRDYTHDDCDKDDAVYRCLTFAGDVTGGLSVHHGGNNVLFADGHVGWYRHFDGSEMTYHPTKMLEWDEVTAD